MALSAINEISNRVLELESRVDVNSSKIDGLEHRLANAELALLELRSVLEKPEPPSLEVYSSPGLISKASSNDTNLISVKKPLQDTT